MAHPIKQKPPRAVVLATGRQLWRLNEQGLLKLWLEDAGLEHRAPAPSELHFKPGGPPEWRSIAHGEADAFIATLLAERWAGLNRWPTPGESWTVQDGLVVPLAAVDEVAS